MTLFLFEFFTGGGCWTLPGDKSPKRHLFLQGAAMLTAVIQDFLRLGIIQVQTLHDVRWGAPTLGVDSAEGAVQSLPISSIQEFHQGFPMLSHRCDATILIAPETDGILLALAEAVLRSGGRLLSPSPEFIRIASDKSITPDALQAWQVAHPEGISACDFIAGRGTTARGAFVVKPNWGAGSEGVRLFPDAKHAYDYCRRLRDPRQYRVEFYRPGRAASVAALCGPAGTTWLAPCWQQLSDDGRLRYLGGSVVRGQQARQRILRIVEPLQGWLQQEQGYVGIDLVLGRRRSGADDYVIEINPRVTASYVGLRRAARGNLAEWWLSVASGKVVRPLFRTAPLHFRLPDKTFCHGPVREDGV